MHRRFFVGLFAVLCAGAQASAATLYTDNFNADTSANYNTYITAGATGPSGDATFAYNYGDIPANGGLSIPVAPHTSDSSTIGLRVRTDSLQASVAPAIVGATSVITKGLTLPSSYQVSVDVWSNYIGGSSIAASGTNGSTGVTMGIGSAGTQNQILNVQNDGLLAEAFGDNGGGADGAYRIYPGTTSPRPSPTNSSYYAAGTTAGSATYSNAYYTSAFPSVSAPAGQVAFASTTQGGSTPAGVQGFAWHTWTITNDTVNLNWSIDGKLITSVPLSAVTLHGQQVTLGNNDSGLTGNYTGNGPLFNAQIFDNLVVSDYPAVPEPTSILLCLVGMIGWIGARRRG